MSQREKALSRLTKRPKDFSWDELVSVMEHFGYEEKSGSGSRRKFIDRSTMSILSLHERHPKTILEEYQIRDVIEHLRERGLL